MVFSGGSALGYTSDTSLLFRHLGAAHNAWNGFHAQFVLSFEQSAFANGREVVLHLQWQDWGEVIVKFLV